jgi:hypothetical protein
MSQIRDVRRLKKNQLAKAGFFVPSSLPLPLVDTSPSVIDAESRSTNALPLASGDLRKIIMIS